VQRRAEQVSVAEYVALATEVVSTRPAAAGTPDTLERPLVP